MASCGNNPFIVRQLKVRTALSRDNGEFRVDVTGVQQLSESTHDIAERVRTCAKSMLHRKRFTTEVFGDCGVLEAVQRFFTTWIGELAVIAGGLDQITTNLHETYTAYATLDTTRERAFRPGC